MSWFDDNDPGAQAGGAGASVEDAAQAYRDLLGREPEPGLAEQWANGIGAQGIAAMRAAISATPEAQAYKTKQSAAPAQGGDAALRAQIAQWASMPGADPSLASNPDYWVQAINSRGGLTDSNRQYWQDASVGPSAFFNNPNRESGGAPATATYGAAPPAYTAPVYETPTWQGGPPPSAPTLTRYTLPTLADLQASPGYKARMLAGEQGQQRSAAAQGSVLNGGSQKALARYDQDYASNEYSNLVGQGQSTVALNNNSTQTEFGDAFANYQARYGQFSDDAARSKNTFDTNAGNGYQAFQTNVTNKRNADTDYWTRLNDLFSTGAQLSNNSYKAP